MPKIITDEKVEFQLKNPIPDFKKNTNPILTLTGLKKLLIHHFNIINTIHRIECYDISNTGGSNATASMVVNTDGVMTPNNYRRFKIKTVKKIDDYAMLEEVLRRRLLHTEWDYPDLIVVDGGFGQLSAMLKVLKINKQNIPCIGLAKREEIICLPNGNAIKLERSDDILQLLQRIRDQSHRFANKYHILLRSKGMLNENVI